MLLASAALLTSISPLVATDRDVPFDYPTIQSAIVAATDGDRVRVWPGTYIEDVTTLGKQLTIEGVEGPERTTIRGTGTTSVVIVGETSVGPVTLRGLTLESGVGFLEADQFRYGGGIYMSTSRPMTLALEDLRIIGNGTNSSCRGGGLCVAGKGNTITAKHLLFAKNRASHEGSAVLLGDQVLADFDRTTAVENSGPDVCTTTGGILRMQNSIIWNVGAQAQLKAITGLALAQYSNILGGYSGTGNSPDDPRLGPDYRPNDNSICIDSASFSPDDPDCTRADRGCYYHDRRLLVLFLNQFPWRWNTCITHRWTKGSQAVFNLDNIASVKMQQSTTIIEADLRNKVPTYFDSAWPCKIPEAGQYDVIVGWVGGCIQTYQKRLTILPALLPLNGLHRIGTPLTLELQDNGGMGYAVYLAAQLQPSTHPRFGTLHIVPLILTQIGVVPGTGWSAVKTSYQVPNAPALKGLAIYFQALTMDFFRIDGPETHFSNYTGAILR